MLPRIQRIFRNRTDARKRKAVDSAVTPESALEEAIAIHARNRERAVQTLAQAHKIQWLFDDSQRKVIALQQKASLALERGDFDLALKLLWEQHECAQTQHHIWTQLEAARESAAKVKAAFLHEKTMIDARIEEAAEPVRANAALTMTAEE